jgi:hypothetical protein
MKVYGAMHKITSILALWGHTHIPVSRHSKTTKNLCKKLHTCFSSFHLQTKAGSPVLLLCNFDILNSTSTQKKQISIFFFKSKLHRPTKMQLNSETNHALSFSFHVQTGKVLSYLHVMSCYNETCQQ